MTFQILQSLKKDMERSINRLKDVGKNYWSVKILVTSTKFSYFLSTKFT